MVTEMKWYLVKLVYQVVSGDGAHTPHLFSSMGHPRNFHL